METFPLLPVILALAFTLGCIWLIKKAIKPKLCELCGARTEDMYRAVNDASSLLCRDHLVSRWKEDMSRFKRRAILIEPDFEKYPHAYLHGGPTELKGWEYPPEAISKVADTIASISGKRCANCTKDATVAFYTKEDFKWPYIEHLSPQPQSYICTSCAVLKVAPLITSAKKPFSEGLYAPRDTEGIYHAQEW